MAPSMDISTLDQDHLALRTALENLGEYRIEYGQLNIDMDSVLGRGGFGVLRRAHFGEEEVAVKILRSDESKDVRVAKRLVREMKIWSGLRHQNVLRLLGFHLSQKLDLAIIVCPLAPHGSLQDYTQREKPSDARRLRLALDALNGLIYLHGLNPPVIHGDIKAANALVNREQRVVLSDFGLAMAASELPSELTTSQGLMGSFRWWSLELFDNKPRSTGSDIWAWAGLFVEVMKDCVPYMWIKDEISVIMAVVAGTLPEPQHRLISPLNLWSVTQLCWEVNQGKRATGIMVLEAVETLIGTVEGISTSEGTTPTPNLSIVTTLGSVLNHQDTHQLQGLDDSRRSASIVIIANQRYRQFIATRNRADLDAAIAYLERALQLRPPGHRDRSGTLQEMAIYMNGRYTADRMRADLDAAIAYSEEALQLRPPGHPDRSVTLYNMAIYMNGRYTADRMRVDLDAAIAYSEEALQLQPPGHPDRSVALHNMAIYMNGRYTADRMRADLDAAIAYSEEALQLRPPGHPGRSGTLHDMALYISERYTEDADHADLDASITYQQEALELQRLEHPGHSQTVQNMVDTRMTTDTNSATFKTAVAFQQKAKRPPSPDQPGPAIILAITPTYLDTQSNRRKRLRLR